MRIMIKGGVWKNTEDEILKAAVMKYGKNQWARVSSLLVRKSAKQCKARWYEWLDPSIKKTEWTREEDEKLLHLAKLMPTQWRTIAPIVGRTPAQCLERYESLLDRAVGGGDGESSDPRRLRPGEVDPNPESRPARPDPVDMDEDEKEMLNEARARLANTKGKKAKRKAREKQLEEARRLASLQKRRELKAAGLGGRYHRKVKGIDYNAEIAFEHKPPPGFYDTSGEQIKEKEEAAKREFRPVRFDELEGKRRTDIEAALIKSDRSKQQILERHNMPLAVQQQMQGTSGPAVKRGKLMLPEPQLSDTELRQIAQMSEQDLADEEMTGSAGGKATNMLLADYSATPNPLATPARTPRASASGSGGDAILHEAENLAKLQGLQSTLMGGEGASVDSISGFTGVTPQSKVLSTPNPLATPLRAQSHGSTGATPVGVMSTPMRDMLQINRSEAAAMQEAPSTSVMDPMQDETQVVEMQRQSVKLGLGKLPLPKNEYQVVIPELPSMDGDAAGAEDEDFDDLEDMADVIARDKARKEEEKKVELRLRSQVLQRNLPRPKEVLYSKLGSISSKEKGGDDDEAPEGLIIHELRCILEHDNAKYPISSKKSGKKRGRTAAHVPDLEAFSEGELVHARQEVEEERQRMLIEASLENSEDLLEAHSKALDACHACLHQSASGLIYQPGGGKEVVLGSLRHKFNRLKEEMQSQSKIASKLEHKVSILNGGFQSKGKETCSKIEETFARYARASEQLEAFKLLHSKESLSVSQRLSFLRRDLAAQQEKESVLQQRYASLMAQCRDNRSPPHLNGVSH